MGQKAHKVQEVIESGAAYTVAGASMTAPMWMQDLTTYGNFVIMIIGIAIAATTLWLNIHKIRELKK